MTMKAFWKPKNVVIVKIYHEIILQINWLKNQNFLVYYLQLMIYYYTLNTLGIHKYPSSS